MAYTMAGGSMLVSYHLLAGLHTNIIQHEQMTWMPCMSELAMRALLQ